MPAIPGTRSGLSVLVTCTDIDPAVVARMFVRDRPWGLCLTCEGGAADQSTLELLDSFHRLFGIGEVVVLHHTRCPNAHVDDEEVGLQLADTLSAIRVRLPAPAPDLVSGFVYDEDSDQLIAWG